MGQPVLRSFTFIKDYLLHLTGPSNVLSLTPERFDTRTGRDHVGCKVEPLNVGNSNA